MKKCFTGSSGQVKLLNEDNGEQLIGPAAEEHLAGLLGVRESISSKQARICQIDETFGLCKDMQEMIY